MFEFQRRSQLPIAKNSLFSRWLPLAIFISLLAHIALLWWTSGISWNLVLAPSPTQAVQQTRPFRLVKPPPPSAAASSDVNENQQKALSSLQQASILPLSVEKIEPKPDMGTLPTEHFNKSPKIHEALLEEKPGDIGNSLDSMIQKTTSELAQKGPILQEAQKASSTTVIELLQAGESSSTTQIATSGRQPGSALPQGFSDLDTLLSQTGPLKPETAPILMPTDVLFEYDNAELRPEAIESLRKLGTLIQRNPQVSFVIEGHTDSFGSEDYNMNLSVRRAEAVKNWLVQTMGITRTETKGYGKSRLLVPASGTVPEQRLNRRVEIMIRGS